MPSHYGSSPEAPQPDSRSILAANVRRLRAESNWSTREFADHASLSLSSLYGIEHCQQRTVRLSTIARLAKAFGVHVPTLLSPEARPREPWQGTEPLALAAAALTTARRSRGWTQEELASKAGVPRDIVAKIERASRNPTLEVLDRLATALGVRVGDLFY